MATETGTEETRRWRVLRWVKESRTPTRWVVAVYLSLVALGFVAWRHLDEQQHDLERRPVECVTTSEPG